MHTKAQDFLHASVALSHPHSSESPVSTSSSSPKRSELITVSDGVYSFPLSHQRHSHQVDCQSGWMSRTCQNHISKISFLLLSKRRGPSSHFSLWMCLLFSCFFFCYILSINILYACTQAIMDFFIVHPPVCISDLLAGEEKKACDEIFLKSSHYLDSELSLSGSAAHYLIAHRNSLMLPVEIGLPDAVHMKKKLRRGEEEESVAINIASLHRLFKILWLSA